MGVNEKIGFELENGDIARLSSELPWREVRGVYLAKTPMVRVVFKDGTEERIHEMIVWQLRPKTELYLTYEELRVLNSLMQLARPALSLAGNTDMTKLATVQSTEHKILEALAEAAKE